MASKSKNVSPYGLMVEFLQGPQVSGISNPMPEFGWIVNSQEKNDMQTSYQILVASNLEILNENKGDMWDSKKVASAQSINVPYNGKALKSTSMYFWKIKTWCRFGGESEWSEIMQFSTGDITKDYKTVRYPLKKTIVPPSTLIRKSNGHYLIDFGKVAFGYLELNLGEINLKRKKKL